MTDSYTITATVTDPVHAVEDMTLSLERVTSLLGNSNSDYMEYVVGELIKTPSLHRIAFNVWCINQVAVEKLTEIQKVLAQTEGELAIRTAPVIAGDTSIVAGIPGIVSPGLAAVLRDANSAHAASAADASDNGLSDAASTADYAVAGHAVSNAADLHAKLAFMVEHQLGDGMDWLPTLLADAARLVGREG